MTAKEYLMQLRNIDVVIRQHDERLKEAYSDAIKLTQVYDLPKIKTSGNKDLSDVLVVVEKIQGSLAQTIAEKYELKAKIIAQIEALDDERYRMVLEAYYVNRLTWEQTAVAIGYDYSWTTRLHGQALQEFEKLFSPFSVGSGIV